MVILVKFITIISTMGNFNTSSIFFPARFWCVALILGLFYNTSHAQELIGGELTYSLDGAIVTYYVTTYSLNAPNSEAWLEYGDGGSSFPELTSVMINDSVYQNFGSASHVFFAPGTYLVTCKSDNLIGDVRNIEDAGTKSLFMDILVYDDFDFLNTAPLHTTSIFDFEITNDCYVTHDESATDAEDDSLVYTNSLFEVYGGEDYSSWPESTDSIGFTDAGLFYWRNTVYRDLYALQFETREYRDGLLVSETVRKIITPVNCGIVSNTNYENPTINIFPNPVSDVLHVVLPLNNIYTYSIFDGTGKLLVRNTNNTSACDVHSLSPGLYILVIQQNGGKMTTTFYKQ